MASASAAGAGDQSNIELRQYGINLTIPGAGAGAGAGAEQVMMPRPFTAEEYAEIERDGIPLPYPTQFLQDQGIIRRPGESLPPESILKRALGAAAAGAGAGASGASSNSLGSSLYLSNNSSLGAFGPLDFDLELALRSPVEPIGAQRVTVQRPVAQRVAVVAPAGRPVAPAGRPVAPAGRPGTPAPAAFANLFPQFAVGAAAVRAPAAAAAAENEDENQVGLPGILGGYKRKRKGNRKHRKTRKQSKKRKATRRTFQN